MLAASFDLAKSLPEVAELCVRRLADYCAIHAQPSEHTGHTVHAGADSLVGPAGADPDDLREALHDCGYATVQVVPLSGRRETLGTFVLASRTTDAFDETTGKLATVLASQIANAVEQAILFERTQRVADRLQRALLPDTFPAVPGASLHGAYRPASDEAEVGGDWYDAFELADGRIAISIGDVAGHGLEAATVMGEVRQAIRTAAMGRTSPASVLEHVNGVINLRAGIGMVTAIFGYYEPERRELTYAVAGHPPPILTIPGRFCNFLPGGGVPLGIDRSIGATDWTITLPPTCSVIFYTDGMTEYGRDVIDGEARLLEACVRACDEDPDNPALGLLERIFDTAVSRDDAATLTLFAHEGPLPAKMSYSAIPLCSPIVRSMMHRFCDQYDLSDDDRFSVLTAVGEAVANCVEHAYRGDERGVFHLGASVEGETVHIEVEDRGRWRPFKPRDERGRGFLLMNELMDRVRINSTRDSTLLSMTLNRFTKSG